MPQFSDGPLIALVFLASFSNAQVFIILLVGSYVSFCAQSASPSKFCCNASAMQEHQIKGLVRSR